MMDPDDIDIENDWTEDDDDDDTQRQREHAMTLPSLDPPFDAERVARQLHTQFEAASLKWASTFAKFAPHYYSLRHTWADDRAFRWCAEAIARLGVPRVWKKRTFVYVDDICPTCGCGWTYWLCGPPGDADLINKARVVPAKR